MPDNDIHLRSDEDVENILSLAVQKGASPDATILRERLESSALEMGISAEQLQEAEQIYSRQVQMGRKSQAERHQLEVDWREYRRIQKKSLRSHLTSYAVVMMSIAGFNWFIEGFLSWVFFPVFGWESV